ncbi:hypothetical protein HMPREF0577_1009 [Mobiluncus mulieris ATCC 35243]|nr:hypothetical protein HMPREF0577_1009 [Mobiluncus mulieris ATCC 35243]
MRRLSAFTLRSITIRKTRTVLEYNRNFDTSQEVGGAEVINIRYKC